ncbi:hypothetical protein XENORESO_015991 [Xenotaenia resolanae]|uniref:Uncharacterized protein n=1 Tax=Xenotaenia resolanae TaxID=208358 RepID=A0ABV0WGC0_9TELE
MKMIKRKNVGPVEEEGYDHESTSETKVMENSACNTSSNFTKRSVEVPTEEDHPGGSLTFQEKVDLIPLNTLEGNIFFISVMCRVTVFQPTQYTVLNYYSSKHLVKCICIMT